METTPLHIVVGVNEICQELSKVLCLHFGINPQSSNIELRDILSGLGEDSVLAKALAQFHAFWTREQRQTGDRERKALRLYHATLCESGVCEYSWENLISDYRLMIALTVFHPVWDETYQRPNRRYWWPKMQCLTDAYEDWKLSVCRAP